MTGSLWPSSRLRSGRRKAVLVRLERDVNLLAAHRGAEHVPDDGDQRDHPERAKGERLEACARDAPGVEEVVGDPEDRLDCPGKTATHEASAIQNVTSPEESQIPTVPPGTRYGRWTSPCEYRSFRAAGKIQRYEISVVEIAIVSTTLNARRRRRP